MATIQRFEDILAWQHARQLSNDLYVVTRSGAMARDRGLKDQLRRAGLSVMLNIAEGFARTTDADFCRFLSIARASVAEVQAALYLSLDQKFISQDQFDRLYGLATETSRTIYGLQKYLDSRIESRGSRARSQKAGNKSGRSN